MKKQTMAELNRLGKNLHRLEGLKIDPKVKALLKREGKKWIAFIKYDMTPSPVDPDDYGGLIDNWYHQGEISFIEFFFGIRREKLVLKKRIIKK